MNVKAAFQDLEACILAHDGSEFIADLAPPCSEEELRVLAAEINVAIPDSLMDLYRCHNGQSGIRCCFRDANDFWPIADALRERARFLERYVQGEYGLLHYFEDPEHWKFVDFFREEVTERWWPIASRGRDYFVMNLDTERVFSMWAKGEYTFVAHDLVAYLTECRDKIASGDLVLSDVGVESSGAGKSPRAEEARRPELDAAKRFVDELVKDEIIVLSSTVDSRYPPQDLFVRLRALLGGKASHRSRAEAIVAMLENAPQVDELFATDNEIRTRLETR